MTKEINKDTILELLAKPAQYEYFFKNLDKPNWFDYLFKLNIFNEIPAPRLIDDGQYIQFPVWWPGKYLTKIADRIPDKVLSVIEKVKTDNSSAIDDCSRAILNMPEDFIAYNHDKIINLYDKWLNMKYLGMVKYAVDDVFDKFIKSKCYDGALKLLNILSKVKKDKVDPKLRFEVYYYKELIKKHLNQLADHDSNTLLSIFEANLKEAIRIETKNKHRKDYSAGWRPAIENNAQNWNFDRPRDIFIDAIRDVLYKMLKESPDGTKRIVKKYLKESYSILRRIGIHILCLSNFDDIIEKLLIDKSNLNNREIYHEFYRLVKDKFSVLNLRQKKDFISQILEIPTSEITIEKDENKAATYKRYWQARQLSMIKTYLEKDDDIKEYKYLLTEYSVEFSGINHPDLLSVHTSWTGPTSALSKKQIEGMTPEQFINWIITNLQPPYEMRGPSPEGVSRIFQEVVKENPEPYAVNIEKFINDKILPTYHCGLLRGLAGAIEANKNFDLQPVIKYMENPLKFHAEPKVDSRHDIFDIGKYSWVRGVIANFIESLVAKDEFILTENDLNKTQTILIELIEKDEDPTEKDEKQYGQEANNMDYVTYCINANRGKAMCALMGHALRRARMRPDEERKKEEGKGPFPPGERMSGYKYFLTKRLDDENSPSVQSSYGRYLQNLYYLDQGWVTNMVRTGKLFPMAANRQFFWSAHWEGYVGFNDFHSQLYGMLKDSYHKAVNSLDKENIKNGKLGRHDDRLAEHLMLAYWYKVEDITKGQIIEKFFNNAPIDVRKHAIWFLSSAIEETKPKVDSAEWQRLKKLWEYRVKNCNDEELGSFARWLKECPEKLSDIEPLIKAIISFLPKQFNEDTFFEYLLLKIEENPVMSLELLDQLLNIRERTFLLTEKINTILSKAQEFKADPKTAQAINKVINNLGAMGYYEFRNLLV